MIIKEYFISFHKKFQKEIHNFWDKSILSDSLYDFIGLIENEFYEASKISPDKFHLTGNIFLEDILTSKANAPNDIIEILNFLQFYYSGKCAKYFCNNGIFNLAHDWLIWSFYDKIDYEAEIDFTLTRVKSFDNARHSFIKRNRSSSYINWMSTLFYYSRKNGGLKGLADLVFVTYIYRASQLYKIRGLDYEEYDAVNLVCQMLAWSLKNREVEASKLLASSLHNWIPNLSIENKKDACMQLAGGGGHLTTKSNQYFAKEIIDKYSHLCRAHDLIHAQAIYYMDNIEELDLDKEAMTQAFDLYVSSLLMVSLSSKKYERARVFGIIRGLIIECLQKQKINLAMHLIKSFYEKREKISYDKMLFVGLNFQKTHVQYFTLNSISKSVEFTRYDYINLTQTVDKFLGTMTMLNDVPDFEMHIPNRHGIPSKEFGNDFEKILESYYGLNIPITLNPKEIDSMIILPGMQHPLQSLMIKKLGYSFPINSSLEKSNKPRKVNKVLLWCYGTLSSDREALLVSKILTYSGIDVDLVDILSETRESFISKYSNPEYDLVWIATHGNYNHSLPHKSTISILPNVDVSIENLAFNPINSKEQRLLFLNICDGATSYTMDSLYEFGFGAGLSNSNQCVLSHLWPVETEPALLYGIVYSHFISLNFDFWNSYINTIRLLNEDNNIIINTINKEAKNDDIEEVKNKLDEQVSSNIYYWGSGVFYN